MGVPDKYAPPRTFATYEEAEAYAEQTSGRVETRYTLRDPDGSTWSLHLSLPDGHSGEAGLGCVVVDRSYQAGYAYQGGPVFSTPEEAQAEAERRGTRTVQERLSLRSPSGDRLEVDGTLGY